MSTRLELIARGRSHATKTFSASKARCPDLSRKLASCWHKEITDSRLKQVLLEADQYMALWEDQLVVLTKVEFATDYDGDDILVASLGNTIGECYPVTLEPSLMTSVITTLMPKGVVDKFNILSYDKSPEEIPGPTPPATTEDPTPSATPPSLARLHFTTSDDEDDAPVIVGIRALFPLEPGHILPAQHSLADPFPPETDYPLLEEWRRALQYIHEENNGFGVLSGGPLFDLAGLPEAPNLMTDPAVLDKLWEAPMAVMPTTTQFKTVRATMDRFSEDTWLHLGLSVTPTLPDTPTGSPTSSDPSPTGTPAPVTDSTTLHALIQSWTQQRAPSAKEAAQLKTAKSVGAFYRLLFAGLPEPGSIAPDTEPALVLPPLKASWEAILANPKPQDACVEMRLHTEHILDKAASSDLAVERDVCLDPNIVTLSFANNHRSAFHLGVPLAGCTLSMLEQQLNMRHFLPVDLPSLRVVVSREASQAPVVLSHVADDRAQLDASRSSKLYTGGRLDSPRDVYLNGINFVAFAGNIVEEPRKSLLVIKILRFCNLLNSGPGRAWIQMHANHPYLKYHIWAKLQHMLTLHVKTASSPALREAVLAGKPISPYNFAVISKTIDSDLEFLTSQMSASDLGLWDTRPIALSLLHPEKLSVPPSPPPSVPQKAATPNPATQPTTAANSPAKKKQRTSPGATSASPTDLADRKTKGMLTWNPPAGVSADLPTCPVRDKVRGKDTQERLCMAFLTLGHACPYDSCNRPHPASVKRLSTDRKRADFIKFVTDTPGLGWAEGRAPPGTPP